MLPILFYFIRKGGSRIFLDGERDFLDGAGGFLEGAGGLLEGAEGLLEGAEGLLEGAEGLLEGAEGLLEGAEGFLEGAEGLLEGAEGFLEGAEGLLEGAEGFLEGAGGFLGGAEGFGDREGDFLEGAAYDPGDLDNTQKPATWVTLSSSGERVPGDTEAREARGCEAFDLARPPRPLARAVQRPNGPRTTARGRARVQRELGPRRTRATSGWSPPLAGFERSRAAPVSVHGASDSISDRVPRGVGARPARAAPGRTRR